MSVYRSDIDGHVYATPALVPAHDGFTALAWVRLDRLAGHALERPVLAWDCSEPSRIKPVTVIHFLAQAVRYPDGRVADLLDGAEFADQGKWQAHAKARANRYAEEQDK